MVSGYLRGATPLCVNSLIHISDFGNFQMSCIKTLRDPYLIEHEQKRYLSDSKMKWKNETEILTADPEKQVSHILILMISFELYLLKGHQEKVFSNKYY